MDVRQGIATQPMRPFQLRVVAICLVLTVVDGFEMLMMAFVAPALGKVWNLGTVQIGYLLSSSIIGLALGALLVSPLADRIGRRVHTIMCLILITVGMAASTLVTNTMQMVSARILTGLFIGGILASLNVMVSEYASNGRRATVMSIYGMGLPLGTATGGFISGLLLARFDWRAPFVFAAITTGTMAIACIIWLPESIHYLVERRPANGLSQYNRIARHLGYQEVTTLPPSVSTERTRSLKHAAFSGIMLHRTIWLWTGFSLLTAAFYFANTWSAKLLSDATGDTQTGINAGVLIAVGGVIGSLIMAALNTRFRPRLVTAVFMFAACFAFLAYANFFTSVAAAYTLAVVIGIFATGAIIGTYAIAPYTYPTAVRASAVGLMIATIRAVSFVAPTLVGYLLAGGWTPRGTYQVFGVLLILAAFCMVMLDRTYRGRTEDPEEAAAQADIAETEQRPSLARGSTA
ncbi:MAG TPA: MFS transporter [Dermatophilaceae bacterium]|nr:MFS transporter [Dermatophilaceae bacterium]